MTVNTKDYPRPQQDKHSILPRGFSGISIPANLYLFSQLTPSDRELLGVICSFHRNDNEFISVSWVASLMKIERWNISKRITRLEKDGFVKREKLSHNSSNMITPTPKCFGFSGLEGCVGSDTPCVGSDTPCVGSDTPCVGSDTQKQTNKQTNKKSECRKKTVVSEEDFKTRLAGVYEYMKNGCVPRWFIDEKFLYFHEKYGVNTDRVRVSKMIYDDWSSVSQNKK